MKHRFLLGNEHYLLIQKDYDAIRTRRKQFKGKPDAYDKLLIELDKLFEAHYKKFLD